MTAVRPAPTAAGSFSAIYRLFLRGQLTRLRAFGLLGLSAVALVLAAVARVANDPDEAAAVTMGEYGLSVVVPVCTLWIATSLMGDLTEDRLLVYLWLKPIPRWVLPTAAIAATATIMVPLVVIPLTIAAVISGSTALITSTIVASVVGVAGYAGLFVTMATRFSRALWWGLAYILVWENALARISTNTARLSIRSYLASIVSRATDEDLALAERGATASIVVPILVVAAAIGLSTWLLGRRDVD